MKTEAEQIIELTEYVKFLTQRASDLRGDRLRLIKHCDSQREEIKRQEIELKEAKKANEAHDKKIQGFRLDIDILYGEIEDEKRENKALKEEIKRQEMVISSLRGEISSLNKNIERINLSKERFCSHILSLNDELAILKSELHKNRDSKSNGHLPEIAQPLTPDQSWKNFKRGVKSMQHRCLMAAMKYHEDEKMGAVPVYRTSKPVWQCWTAHYENENESWVDGEGKPLKDDIFNHFEGLILMRLAFKHPQYEYETEITIGFNEGKWEQTFTINNCRLEFDTLKK